MKDFHYKSRFLILLLLSLFLVIPVASATMIPSGTPDPDFIIEHYQPGKTWNGTTLFADYHTADIARIVEVNMNGEIVWQYKIPDNLKRYTNPGFDVQLLPNNHIMYLLPGNGVYEIDRSGNVLWSYLDSQVSHDFKRLPNGNTLINRGNEDTKDSAQAIEVDPSGKIVWQWFAKSVYDKPPYNAVNKQGWTHANAVTRLPNGNTQINLRNFNLTVEVNPQGVVVWQYDWSSIGTDPHEPSVLSNGNILASFPAVPDKVVELNPKTEQIIWQYVIQKIQPMIGSNRDADRLPNENTLINEGTKILEVTPSGEIVWQLTVKGLDQLPPQERLKFYLFKSERIGYMDPQLSIVSPQPGVCSQKDMTISIQYSDVDLNRIWYRIYDRNTKNWVTDNITYVQNNWNDALTFIGKETGKSNVALENGDYTLHVWASSNGWGDENLYVPKKINTIEKTVDFSVSLNCAPSQTLSPSLSQSPSALPSSTQPLPTKTPLTAGITIGGILLIVIAYGKCKK